MGSCFSSRGNDAAGTILVVARGAVLAGILVDSDDENLLFCRVKVRALQRVCVLRIGLFVFCRETFEDSTSSLPVCSAWGISGRRHKRSARNPDLWITRMYAGRLRSFLFFRGEAVPADRGKEL